ncbi:hypothetical protein NAC44_02905 [Allorhizobium sp. BGMRC 0089]|uniref:hypothetical protein n=1 Tax=Allorhizobium sonneratiae TaxID=2934936 RepID=UPI0020332ED8|nr:hypothetical protein [Allorhizobium sonneratiae]MCM2291276.1 hypothetical protein [Allorhizobium sonneratiae]
MTTISSLNTSASAMSRIAQTQQSSQASETAAVGSTGKSRHSIGSSSAANVPSSIAALSLRSSQNESASDTMVNGKEVNDHDGDDG